MKKWVITGTALALVLQMGNTALAADSSVFLARNIQEGIVRCHRFSRGDTCGNGLGCGERYLPGCAGRCLQECVDGSFCVRAGGNPVNCILNSGYGAGNGSGQGADTRGNGYGAGNGGNCPVVDGNCQGWTDADGDGICDRCRNPVFQQNSQQTMPETPTGVAENVEASSESQVIQTEEPAVYGVETQSIIYGGGNGGYNAGNGGYGCPSGHHGEGCGNSGSGHHGRGHHR